MILLITRCQSHNICCWLPLNLELISIDKRRKNTTKNNTLLRMHKNNNGGLYSYAYYYKMCCWLIYHCCFCCCIKGKGKEGGRRSKSATAASSQSRVVSCNKQSSRTKKNNNKTLTQTHRRRMKGGKRKRWKGRGPGCSPFPFLVPFSLLIYLNQRHHKSRVRKRDAQCTLVIIEQSDCCWRPGLGMRGLGTLEWTDVRKGTTNV